MAARAIGTSTIAFGLVSLPVKLYSTGESARRISFNMVHKECGTRVRQQYICPTDDVVVSREDIVKGYEFSKGQFVLFDDEELKVVEAPKLVRCEFSGLLASNDSHSNGQAVALDVDREV